MKTIPDFKMAFVQDGILFEDDNAILWGDGAGPTIAYTRDKEVAQIAETPSGQMQLDELINHIRGANLTNRERAEVAAEIEADGAANMASVNAALDVFYDA